jgi:ketosteroid isomerase-like protein
MDSNQNNTNLVKDFTEAMTHEGIEAMMKLWAPDGEWVIMATGETFKGPDQIRQLATRSVAARTHGSGEGLLPFNVFTNTDGTRLCWEYVHKAVVTDQWPASKDRPAPGSKVEIPIVLICEISQGKLTKIREYFDLTTATEPGVHRKLYS